MTPTNRIELAARAIDPEAWNEVHPAQLRLMEARKRAARAKATRALPAAFPELMLDPPSHWVAPLEATEGMQEAAENSLYWQDVWDAFRVTYLKEQANDRTAV